MLHRHLVAGIIFSLVLGSHLAQAETRLGAELGANFSSYAVTPAPASIKGRTGLLVGGLLEFTLTEVFALQPGLRYIQKGFSSGDYQQTEHYVEVPLLVKARIRASDKAKVYFLAGPNFGYELAAKYSPLIGGVIFNNFDVALDLGAGVEFALSPKLNLFLQGRYSLGLINVVNTDDTPGASAKSRGVQLSAGLTLPL